MKTITKITAFFAGAILLTSCELKEPIPPNNISFVDNTKSCETLESYILTLCNGAECDNYEALDVYFLEESFGTTIQGDVINRKTGTVLIINFLLTKPTKESESKQDHNCFVQAETDFTFFQSLAGNILYKSTGQNMQVSQDRIMFQTGVGANIEDKDTSLNGLYGEFKPLFNTLFDSGHISLNIK